MSCLFNSLNYFIKEDSYLIRNKICDYLEQNNKIMDGLETKFIIDLDSNNYIQNMRNESTWGGAIEIQVACNIWNLRIIVHNYRDKISNKNNTIEFIPINNNIDKSIELYWTGGHYEPIRYIN
jgi:hypothetical protein